MRAIRAAIEAGNELEDFARRFHHAQAATA
jgi:hypothetical protein